MAAYLPPRERARAGIDLAQVALATLIVIALVALALLAWTWRDVLLLVFASIVIAAGLRGLAKPIAKRTPLSEPWAIGAAFLIIIAALAAVMALFGAQIASQVETLSETLPRAWRNVQTRVAETEAGGWLLEQAQAQDAGGVLTGLASSVGRYGLTFASGALDAFLVIIAAIFFALSPASYRDGALLLAPKRLRPELARAMDDSGDALRRWLGGTLVSMAAMTVMVTVALWLLGVPAPLGLGLLSGLGQIVPFIGPIVAAAPGILLALAVEPITAVYVALAYFIASTIEANILYPLIMKRSVDQPPVITIYAIVAFGALLGPLGVLLALPITVVASIFVVRFYVNRTLGDDVEVMGRS